MTQGKIGLLPLYLKLYDDVSQESRPRIEEFVRTIASAFEKRGVSVAAAPVCRIAPEFDAAVRASRTRGSTR